MAGQRTGTWFGFGFCGFGQALGAGQTRQVLGPERLQAPADLLHVSAGWSYTALVTGAGRLQLSGAVCDEADGCEDAWAAERLLVVVRGRELQGWAPAAALHEKPLWTRVLEPDADPRPRALPLLPGAYVSPRPPFYRPLPGGLRARRLELGSEHALLLDAAGQVFSWGAGRHGQLGHGTLEAEPEPRPLEALQGLSVARVAAGGWHSVCVSESGDIYIWGWNESGQLALPTRSLAGDKSAIGQASGLNGGGSAEERVTGAEDTGPAPFITIQPFPALLDLPLGSEAAEASCGSRHTAVVTRTGELYTWGWEQLIGAPIVAVLGPETGAALRCASRDKAGLCVGGFRGSAGSPAAETQQFYC
ncbi:RCC1 domain-containing protein 1 isoform X2 [Erinaceus europaeus]|uniref:RCC1 domain-containing protein 1 isoform X2 n=1 Tax=Erinaceus europaeus TaxID=9365 RepID=A0ABM3WFW5_ERIEU|nr:RCC1 domain-containing protein 1 isoform X2 [Erinaceus europaeus]